MNNVYPAFTRREYPLYPEVCQRRISKPSSAPQNSSRRSQANEPHGRRAPAVGAQSQRVASQLEELTNLASRLTILGHVQRGGTPSAFDRVLATHLGTACARYVGEGNTGSMIGLREGRGPAGRPRGRRRRTQNGAARTSLDIRRSRYRRRAWGLGVAHGLRAAERCKLRRCRRSLPERTPEWLRRSAQLARGRRPRRSYGCLPAHAAAGSSPSGRRHRSSAGRSP